MTDTAITVFRDFVTDGVPSSGAHKPSKPAIRALLTGYEVIINAFTSSGGLIYSSLASLNSDLTRGADTMAWVIGDPVAANNGVYGKVGASGSGSWARRADLPFSFIIASNVGDGTPNAIQATTSIPVSGSALIWVNVFKANTGPVTVSFNGGAPLAIKTNTGNDVSAGGLVAGMIVLGIVSGGTYRILNDQVSTAIVAAAEAAAATAAAAANGAYTFTDHAAFMASSIGGSVTTVFVSGYYNPNGKGAKRLHRISAPGVPNAIQFQIADGSWWQISDSLKNPAMLGARVDGATADDAAYAALIAYANTTGETWEVPAGVSCLTAVHECLTPVVMTGVIKCGVTHTTTGLRLRGQPIVIGDYLRIYCDGDISLLDPTQPSAHLCHTAALQAAANELMSSTKFVSLNMEGRRLTTSQQINFDLGLTPANDANRASRYASNFIIDAHSSFTNTDYIFRVFSSSAPSPSKMNFSNFTLNCGGYASGILYDGAAFDNIATHFRIRNPSYYGINKPNSSGSDFLLSNFILEGRTDITLEEKVAIGLNYAGSDLQIANGIIRNHLNQLICDGGAQNLITNVHFYGGGNASATARRPAGVLLKNSRSAQFSNCYFDGQPFVSLRDDGANTVGYFECTGCLFVVGSNASATAHSYIEVETGPASIGATIEDIIIKDCRFIRGAGGADIEQPMRARGSGTSSTAQKDVYIFDNTFTNVREQASKLCRYTARVSGSGGLAWNLDVSTYRAFGMNFQHASAPGIVSDVNPGATWVERTGANTFVVRYATAFNGSIKMEFDANSANP